MLRSYFRFQGMADMTELAAGSTWSRMTRLGHWDQFARIRAEPRRWVVEPTFACFGRHPSPRQRLRGSIHP
jgi:hypothetical protein